MAKTKQRARTILVSAGASGGHIFPALSVADELKKMGFNCVFVGGGKQFDTLVGAAGYEYEELPASPWNVRNPVRKALAVYNLFRALFTAMSLIHKYNPSVVFGTGGYATVATVMAAWISGVPTLVHEQNVLPGRANRFLSRFVDRMALAFEPVEGKLKTKPENMKILGNPVREEVLTARTLKRPEDGLFRLLVVGGSQGARILSNVVPKAIEKLPQDIKSKLVVIQQARPEDLENVTNAYTKMGIQFKVQSFFTNLPKQMATSNLMIGRAGTSTVVECALLGRTAIFVPLELADGHQILNAKVLTDENAAELMYEKEFTVDNLAEKLEHLITAQDKLFTMEKRAATLARPDAAVDVAKEVLDLSSQDVMSMRDDLSENGAA